MYKPKVIISLVIVSLFVGFSFFFYRHTIIRKQNKLFLTTICQTQNINKGIRIVIIPITSQGKLIDYLVSVKNNIRENVIFPDHGFGLRTYYYDQHRETWTQIETNIWPKQTPLIVTPDEQPFRGQNGWMVNKHNYSSYPSIRLYIEGQGVDTQQKFGTYFDLVFP